MASSIMNEPITIFQSLPEKDRPRKLVKMFEDKYGVKPTYVARAPGRVSEDFFIVDGHIAEAVDRYLSLEVPLCDQTHLSMLITHCPFQEHIDYAGLSVLPAAIDRDVLMACSAKPSQDGTSRIRIANVSSRFPTEELSYPSGSDGPVLDPKAHSWVNYFKAGLQGVLGQLPEQAKQQDIDLSIMVDGNVPPAGGLSSSAAMVVSSAIASLQAYGTTKDTPQGQLAEIAITSGKSLQCSTDHALKHLCRTSGRCKLRWNGPECIHLLSTIACPERRLCSEIDCYACSVPTIWDGLRDSQYAGHQRKAEDGQVQLQPPRR